MNGHHSLQLDSYQPSGVVPLAGAAAVLLAGAAAGSLLAAVYAFANHHDPLLYLNILLVYAFGTSLGWVVSAGVRRFQIRSARAAAAIASIVFAVAYAVHWCVYVSAVIVDFETKSPYDAALVVEWALELLQNPKMLWGFIRFLNEEGVWSVSGRSSSSSFEVRGMLLFAVWAAEALVLCYLSVKKPWEEAGKPYSERLGKWMDAQTLPTPAAFIEDPESFRSAAARNDYSALTKPFVSDPDPDPGKPVKYATVVLYSDFFEAYVSVRNVAVVRTKKKKSTTTQDIVRYLKIPSDAARNVAAALAGAGTGEPSVS
jgi:hypothetical protein